MTLTFEYRFAPSCSDRPRQTKRGCSERCRAQSARTSMPIPFTSSFFHEPWTMRTCTRSRTSGSKCFLSVWSGPLTTKVPALSHHEVNVEEVIEEPAFLDHRVTEYASQADSIDVARSRHLVYEIQVYWGRDDSGRLLCRRWDGFLWQSLRIGIFLRQAAFNICKTSTLWRR